MKKSFKQKLSLVLACFMCAMTAVAVSGVENADVVSSMRPVIDLGTWSSAADSHGANHAQGVCVDDEGKYMYTSFTNMLVKSDVQTGEIVGTVTGLRTGSLKTGAHIGDICYYNGKIYGTLDYRPYARWYIAEFDVSKITGMNTHYTTPGLMKALYIPQVTADYEEELFAGEHENDPTSMGHRYGVSGVDDMAIGPLPGGGYDTDGDGDVDISTGDKKFLYIYYGSYGNAKRYDNENNIFLVYDFDDMTEQNLLPFHEDNLEMEYTEEQSYYYKHKMFSYVGNHAYGIQQTEYDPVTGDYWLEGYAISDGSEFPQPDRFVIDGSVPLYMDEVEVGQSVTGDATGFLTQAEAHATAALYTDYEDGDGDGDYSEQEQGWHVTLKCLCGDGKTLDDHNEAIYGVTGHPCRICGRRSQFKTGFTALGNDLFYGLEHRVEILDGVTYYNAIARLYQLNRETYTFDAVGHYPYMLEDFETGLPTYDGFGGSRHAFDTEVAGTWSDVASFNVGKGAKAGDDLHFSTWIRLNNTELATDTVTFVVYGLGKVYRTSEDTTLAESREVGAYIQMDVTATGLKCGEWVQVTATKENWDGKVRGVIPAGYDNKTEDTRGWMETVEFSFVSLRLYGPKYAKESVSVVDYSVDDFHYWVSSDDEALLNGGNIVSGSAMDSEADINCWTGTNKAFVNKTGPDGSAGYMSLGSTSASTSKELKQTVTIKTNRLYKVSFWARIEAVPEGTEAAGGVWMLQYMKSRIPDTNGFNTNYPGVKMKNTLTTEWKKFDFYYLREYKTFVEETADLVFRFFLGTDENVAKNMMKLNVDDLRVVDAGSVANGSFDVSSAGVYRNNSSNANSYDVLGWREDGASAAVENGALKITTEEEGGKVSQGINMENGGTYKLTFRAKTSAGEKPLAVVLDRHVASSGGDSEVYSVPDYQYITGTNEMNSEYSAGDWVVTNTWQNYECYITNEFPLLSGKTETTGIIPRTPIMYFDMDGNKAETELYIDDVSLTQVSAAPVASNAKVIGENRPEEVLTFGYQFVSPKGVEESGVLTRALVKIGDTYASLGTMYKGESFIVPESAIGKDLVFAFTPIDIEGTVGETVYVTPDAAAGAWAKLYVDSETLTARAYASYDTDAEVLFAAYKGNELFDVEIVPVSLVEETKVEALGAALSISDADTIKVMLWNASDSAVPLCKNIILTNN